MEKNSSIPCLSPNLPVFEITCTHDRDLEYRIMGLVVQTNAAPISSHAARRYHPSFIQNPETRVRTKQTHPSEKKRLWFQSQGLETAKGVGRLR